MRRLLYIAIGLVLLTIVGMAAARIVSSDAYVARAYVARIREGMSQDEVRGMMKAQQLYASRAITESRQWDHWEFGDDINVAVEYELPASNEFSGGDPNQYRVSSVFFFRQGPKTTLDELLEFLGFPKVEVGFGQTFAF